MQSANSSPDQLPINQFLGSLTSRYTRKDGNPPQDPYRGGTGAELAEAIAGNPQARAQQAVDAGRAALSNGNISAAIGWYQQAIENPAPSGSSDSTAQQLRAELQATGVDVDRLQSDTATNRLPSLLRADERTALRLRSPFAATTPPTIDGPIVREMAFQARNAFSIRMLAVLRSVFQLAEVRCPLSPLGRSYTMST